jgi:hypothetical protein
MKETIATIERVRLINARYQQIELGGADESLKKMKPGQSMLAHLIDHNPEIVSWQPYLRERWWSVGVTVTGTLVVERPTTQRYEPGQFVSLIGPVGEHYKFRKSLRSVLLIAYDTEPTPLTSMSAMLQRSQVNTTLVLLGTARQYETTHLAPEIEVIRGDDDMSWRKQILDVGNADMVFVVAGQDDELYRFAEVFNIFKEKRTEVNANYIFGVVQSSVPCGVGACGACGIKLKDSVAYACTQGPAFDLTQVVLPEVIETPKS